MNTMNHLENMAEPALPVLAAILGKYGMEESALEEYRECSLPQAMEIYTQSMEELAADPSYERFLHLWTLAGGPAGGLVVSTALACALYPRLEGLLLTHLEGGCSLSLAGHAGLDESYAALYAQYDALAKLLPQREENVLFFRSGFYMDERLLHFLSGLDQLPQTLEGLAEIHRPQEELQPLYLDQELVSQVKAAVQDCLPLQLAAEPGRGKRLLLRHALAELGQVGIFVDGPALCADQKALTYLWQLRREALLLKGVICFHGADEGWSKHSARLPQLTGWFKGLPLCLCSGVETQIGAFAGNRVRLVLPAVRREDSIRLWEGYCRQLGIEGMDCRLAGTKYRLIPGQVAGAVQRIARAGEATPEVLLRACMDVLPPAGGNVRQMQVGYTFDDLKVPEHVRSVLDCICAHVNHRELVYTQWGLERRYPYGRSVCALFSGSPGTGKTMAAHVLSTALSIPLYSINLSEVVDKYIGETEKKLEQVFTMAERSHSILFFDEADSLFGKRSEVSEAKDRYANIEVSYLLQRLEQFDGIAILATNNRSNMDDAFLRRIRYVADFPMPDEFLRRAIWESCFTQDTPLLEVDLDFLAHQFTFSGGDIKNVALNAAFLAAQSGSPGVSMVHILQSIRMEYLKANRVLMKSELGDYVYLLD